MEKFGFLVLFLLAITNSLQILHWIMFLNARALVIRYGRHITHHLISGLVSEERLWKAFRITGEI